MKYPNNTIQSICFGNHQLERRVLTFKKLGVKIRLDLTWNYHIDSSDPPSVSLEPIMLGHEIYTQ